MAYSLHRRRSLIKRLYSLSAVSSILWSTVFISLIALIWWFFDPRAIVYFALQPESIAAGRELWTLVLHMFVHGGIAHLFVNMFVLFSLGGLCERLIGKRRFFAVYLIAGIFAGVLSVCAALLFGSGVGASIVGNPKDFMVGASGAIFALAGLLMVLLPRLRFSIIFLPFFSLPAYIMVPLVLAVTWIISIFAGWNIGNVAHLGGFLVGAGYGYYLRLKYQRKVRLMEQYFQ
jgi:membrane associated rhomboid family serine protease